MLLLLVLQPLFPIFVIHLGITLHQKANIAHATFHDECHLICLNTFLHLSIEISTLAHYINEIMVVEFNASSFIVEIEF